MEHPRYDATTQALHWLITFLVIAVYGIGLYRSDIPKGDYRTWLTMVHMSLGMLAFALTLARVMWRSTHVAPPHIIESPLMRFLAKAGHLALYAGLIIVPVLAILMMAAKNRDMNIFGLFSIPPVMAISNAYAKTLEKAHEIGAHILMVVAAGHALVGIFHHHVLKDGTLVRMMPGKSSQG